MAEKTAPILSGRNHLLKIIFSCNSRVWNLIRNWSGQNLWEKYYSNLTRILFSRLWLIRLSHRVGNPLEKLILAVFNSPKLNLFDCLIIGPITVDVIHLNHSLKIRFREGRPIYHEPSCRPWVPLPRRSDPELGKKEKKRVGFGFWSTDGLPREKKKKITKKTKKVCVLN